jgi:hypothetical protein
MPDQHLNDQREAAGPDPRADLKDAKYTVRISVQRDGEEVASGAVASDGQKLQGEAQKLVNEIVVPVAKDWALAMSNAKPRA